jgi:phosphohistidine phosphatase
LTTVDDFDRPLNPRGKKDAPEMAEELVKQSIRIDAFISSPAKRARKTAQVFAKAFDRGKEDIILIEELYNAPAAVFYKVVSNLDDAWNSVAVFSHNPGTTDFVNSLTDVRVDNVPTCGIFAIKIHSDNWMNFQDARKEFWFFNYPKLKHH